MRHFSPDPVPMECSSGRPHRRHCTERGPQAAVVLLPCDRLRLRKRIRRRWRRNTGATTAACPSSGWTTSSPWNRPRQALHRRGPALIIVFRKVYDRDEETGRKNPNYYVQESCESRWASCWPPCTKRGWRPYPHASPMNFLAELLDGPKTSVPSSTSRWVGLRMTPPCRIFRGNR